MTYDVKFPLGLTKYEKVDKIRISHRLVNFKRILKNTIFPAVLGYLAESFYPSFLTTGLNILLKIGR